MRRVRKTNTRATGWRMVATMVAPLWTLPALAINVAWEEGLLSPWNVAACASIAAAALFTAAACQAKTRGAAFALALAAVLLTTSNTLTAFTNASHRTNDGRDHRETQIAAAERQKQQRSQWSQSRKSAATIAGEKPAATIQAEIDLAIATNARRWASTGHCAPASVTARASMAFCGQVAALRGQLGAAERRDDLDARIGRLDHDASKTDVVSNEPLLVASSNLAAAIGLPLPEAVTNALPAMRDALRALTLELIAALGPAAWLVLWRTHAPLRSQAAREVRNQPSQAIDNVAAFIDARVEQDANSTAKAGDMWSAWQAWCAEHSHPPGTQKRFGQAVAHWFKRDRNGGRPRYVGARIRSAAIVGPSRSSRVLPFAAHTLRA